MRVLHFIHSYTPPHIPEQDIYLVEKGFSDYKRFWNVLKETTPDVIHMRATGKETFGIYALIAFLHRIKVVRTLYAPIMFTYWYILKQLCARHLYGHTICTSKYDMDHIDQYHLAGKSKRSLIYRGIDLIPTTEILKKDTARSFIYKKLGIAFTKNIRIVGTVIRQDEGNGVEHLIDAAYLADKYKNLTNTIFVILHDGHVDSALQKQIENSHVQGICFIVDQVENPEQYIPAFDIFISPRTSSGDLYTLLTAMYMHVPCIATRVGDAYEFEPFVAAPLVPMQSAKFLTEALMYVIQHESPTSAKLRSKIPALPKKLTHEHELMAVKDIYHKVIRKIKHITIS
ncbi:MAG: glycosyltransferase [Patescibacteria group bacterium]